MLGYKLSESEHDQVQGQFINPYQFINCVQDINDVWFFFGNDQDKESFKDTEFMWLFDLPQGEYVPKPTPNPFNETQP
jgi:hypothetical protein